MSKAGLDTSGRSLAAALALIWIVVGLWSIYLGASRAALDLTALGTIATGYGMLWFRVAWRGRRIKWPLGRSRRAKSIEISSSH